MYDPLAHLKTPSSYADYLQWGDSSERWELIDGVPYDMTAAPNWEHQQVLGELHYQVYGQLRDRHCRVAVGPCDVRLPDVPGASDEETYTVVQPDLLVVCDWGKIDPRGVRGAPDWVVEILSPTTRTKDLQIKAELYRRHWVKEYWIVDPDDQSVTVLLLSEDGQSWRPSRVAAREETVEVTSVPGLAVDLRTLFGSR